MSRSKLVHIADDLMLDILEGKIRWINKPEGSYVSNVNYRPEAGATIVRLTCNDFDEVPPGRPIPDFVSMWEETHD